MFRLYLRKKLLSGDGDAQTSEPTPVRRNRRILTRYNIDHKHLTLMNDADILLVREISAKGFSVEVSARAFARFASGDVYEARIRYLGELYDLKARVTWKNDHYIGFELVEADRDTYMFLQRLLKPMAVAFSLHAVDAAFMDQNPGKHWWHGDDDSDLTVWHDVETQSLTAWRFSFDGQYVEWRADQGLSSGALVQDNQTSSVLRSTPFTLIERRDAAVDPQKRQFAVDVFMAMPVACSEELLATIAS